MPLRTRINRPTGGSTDRSMAAALGGALLALATSAVHAAPVYEGFDLPRGTALAGSSGGTSSSGWASNWEQSVNGTPDSATTLSTTSMVPAGSYTTGLATADGSVSVTNLTRYARSFNADLSGDHLFASFVVQASVATLQRAFIVIAGASDAVSLLASPLEGGWVFNNRNGGLVAGSSTGTAQQVVMDLGVNVDGDNDEVKIWFDADPTSAAPTLSLKGRDFTKLGSGLTTFSFSTDNTFGFSTVAIDEIRLGGTLADVVRVSTPPPPNGVPEPASLALVLGGLAASTWGRRRAGRAPASA